MLQAYVKLAGIVAALLIGVSALALTRPEQSSPCAAELRSAETSDCRADSTDRDEEFFQRVSY
jgi:hypothetical protein